MTEHGFLRASEVAGWSVCPGRPWREDHFPASLERGKPDGGWLNAFKARAEVHQDAGAQVQIVANGRVDLSVVTSEKHASGTADLLIAQYAEHSILEVWKFEASEDEVTLLAFAAFLHHCLLHNFTSIVLHGALESTHTPDELYVFGQHVTEAAHLALSIEGEPQTSDFVPSECCATCRGRKDCPGLKRRAALDLV